MSNTAQNGKGSRPRKVDPRKFGAGWERVFGKKETGKSERACCACATRLRDGKTGGVAAGARNG